MHGLQFSAKRVAVRKTFHKLRGRFDGTLSGWLEPRDMVLMPFDSRQDVKDVVLKINDSGAAKIKFGEGFG